MNRVLNRPSKGFVKTLLGLCFVVFLLLTPAKSAAEALIVLEYNGAQSAGSSANDSDNAFDTSTNRFTVPSGKAGKYFFQFSILGGAGDNDLNRIHIALYKNGSSILTGADNDWTNQAFRNNQMYSASGVIDLSVGDYLVCEDGTREEIFAIPKITTACITHNMDVEDDDTYVVRGGNNIGYIAHNVSAPTEKF